MRSFNGTCRTCADCIASEDYWKLIGATGSVLKEADGKTLPGASRVLVQFDVNLDTLGLTNHNHEPNSLWILLTDLESAR